MIYSTVLTDPHAVDGFVEGLMAFHEVEIKIHKTLMRSGEVQVGIDFAILGVKSVEEQMRDADILSRLQDEFEAFIHPRATTAKEAWAYLNGKALT